MATESLARLHQHSHGDYGDGDQPKIPSGGWVGGTETPAALSYSVVIGCGLGQVVFLAPQHHSKPRLLSVATTEQNVLETTKWDSSASRTAK